MFGIKWQLSCSCTEKAISQGVHSFNVNSSKLKTESNIDQLS